MKKIVCLFACLFIGNANAIPTSIGNVTDNGGGSYTMSTGTGSVSDASIESFLGLSSGTLDGISTGDATEGSAIQDSMSISVGDIFSFNWLWSSNEGPGSFFNDFAFVSLSLDGTSVLADTFTLDFTSDSFSWVATASGTLNYGIGVMDLNDTVVDSFFTVDSINIESVPEPGVLSMLALGLLGMVFSRKSKKI